MRPMNDFSRIKDFKNKELTFGVFWKGKSDFSIKK